MRGIKKIRVNNTTYEIDTGLSGYTYVDNSLTIPTNYAFVQCDVASGGSLRFSGSLQPGETMKIFLRNKTSNPFTVYLPRSQNGKNNVFLCDKKEIVLNRWTLIEVTCFETNAYIIDFKQQIY